MEEGYRFMGNFLEIFEKIAVDHPDKVVMYDMDCTRKTTYKEMAELVARVSAKLRTKGYESGTFITLQMDRCMEYIAAYFGIIRAGLAVVPTVPEYPEERVAYIMEDCKSPLILREDFFEDIYDFEPEPLGELAPESIVCMNYTSGSTGHPKGVYYSLKCVSESIKRVSVIYDGLDELLTASTVSFSFAALCHDCLTPICAGGTVHLISEKVRRDVELLAQYFEEHGIICGSISPGMLRYFEHTSKLKRVFATGERVVDIYSDKHETYCVYGLTEAYTCVSYFLIDKKYDNTPIGKPIGDIQFQILDEDGNEVPDGDEGVIYVTGYMASGYYHMPEETDKFFEKLPDGKTRYCTRDIGYRNENGDIIYVNRKDWMVKINGQRVEPFEIEAAVSAINGIDACIVKDFIDASGKTYLVAYYISSDADITRNMIEEKLAQKLPPYMMPAFYVQLDAFPRTLSGKIDKKQLMAPKASDFQKEYEAPINETEKCICNAMAKVLKLERVGRQDDFFEMGGDSLLVLQLTNEIGHEGLKVADIVRGRTPSRIASIMTSAVSIETDKEMELRKNSFPLTAYQKAYYRYWEFEDSLIMGNTPVLLRFRKDLFEAQKLADAAYKVLSQHPAYSTVIYKDENGEIKQRFDKDIVTRPSVTCLNADEFVKYKSEMIRVFDLRKCLYRCEIVDTPEWIYLFLDTHHIISDAESINIFKRDLFKALKGEDLAEDYYCSYLDYLNGLGKEMPSDIFIDDTYSRHPDFDKNDMKCITEIITFVPEMTSKEFRKVAEERGATGMEMLMAAALRAVGEFNNTNKVVTNWIYNGRNTILKNDMSGLMISAMSVAVDLTDYKDTKQLCHGIREMNESNMKYSDLSPGSSGTRPIIDDILTVNYLSYSRVESKEDLPEGVDMESFVGGNKAKTNSFYIIFREMADDEKPFIDFKYNSSMYSRENMERFAKLFEKYLEV